MTSPYFPFYPRDWLLDYKVRCLSWAERAIYFDLLCHLWLEKTCTLPNDDKYLSKILLIPIAKWRKIKYKLFVQNEIFLIQNERVFNKRLSKEFEVMQKKVQVQSQNAKKRWSNDGSKPASNKESDAKEGMPWHKVGMTLAMPLEQIQNRTDTEYNNNNSTTSVGSPAMGEVRCRPNDYVVVLEKYVPGFVFTQKNMRLGELWSFWQGKGVMPEDVERAMDYAREMGKDVKSPYYVQDIAVKFAMHRREPISFEAPKSKQTAIDEQNARHQETIRKAKAIVEAAGGDDAT